MLDLGQMVTESRDPDTMNLDQMNPLEIITVMNNEDRKIADAIQPWLPKISKIVEWAIESLDNGGRIIYMGAGTSGRLGVLDAAECPPTFGVSPKIVEGMIAGGSSAFIKAVEGAEDNKELGKEDLVAHDLNKNDIVIGLAASGRTPYVIGGLDYAGSIGCHTAAISCNKDSAIGKAAEIAVDAVVGPEILTGSTRLKAGTAEKMILNMISTATMVGIGKTYENLMVDVMQTNEKLHARAENIVMTATGVSKETAKIKIKEAEGNCKTAITMILAECTKEEAVERLKAAKGHIRKAIV
ncbi:MAG: N-acetylmuramic acid 6-phosphate etherase [Lachnospiraceae bacterium]|nr:N-acetylmuramic acid 6-phosphate etherase [Lachnospiraceae bacterium]